jgi:hypothetical protein
MRSKRVHAFDRSVEMEIDRDGSVEREGTVTEDPYGLAAIVLGSVRRRSDHGFRPGFVVPI